MTPLIAALLAFAPAPAPQVDLDWKWGVLGTTWRLRVEWPAPAPQVWFLVPSFSAGPTPLALFDPGDPRSLEVGLDLLGLTASGVLVGSDATVDFGLPVVPALLGLALHAQAFTVPGATTLVDELSPPVRVRLSSLGLSQYTLDPVPNPRRHHAALRLADGAIVLLGGNAPGGAPVSAIERFEPGDQTFAPAGLLAAPRARAAATELADGRVLLTGGLGTGDAVLDSAVLYDPVTQTTSPAPNLSAPRVFHSQVRLADGRVLVLGGSRQFTSGHPIGFPGSCTGPLVSSLELFDPATNSWSSGPNLPTARTFTAATRLLDGRVLITGGLARLAPGVTVTTAQALLYDPATNGLSVAAPLPTGRALHLQITAADGRGLVVGGGRIDVSTPSFMGSTSTLFYDLGSNAWSVGPPTPGIITCADIICTDRPTGSIFPPTMPPTPWPIWPSVVSYFAHGGLASLDLATGAATVQSAIFRMHGDYSAWATVGAALEVRPGSTFTQLDEYRFLIHGAAQGPGIDTTAELYTLQ
jgi:hypothetical protein